MALFGFMSGWFGRGGALAQSVGEQHPVPDAPLVQDSSDVGLHGAMQISAVWACVERRANVIASLPFFAYEVALGTGQKSLARTSLLYSLLHDSPNRNMTPLEFWRAMVMWHDLRGNAYARIERNPTTGEATELWPMASDQTRTVMLDDSTVVYEYTVGADVAVISADNVLHLKGLGNGNVGLSRLDYMRATTDEAAKAQGAASRMFGNGGKPTGVLMIDKTLTKEQRDSIRQRFGEMATGPMQRLYVLEAAMKYERLSLTPEDQQLLETRNFGVEEICRWFDVPPVLVHHSNVTTWGSGIEQIVSGFHKFTIRPMLVGIEQAVRKRVMTPAQRARMTVEINFDALLRGDPAARSTFYTSGLQNGWITRNEVRQLENLPPVTGPGGDALTAQSQLVPIDLLGKTSSVTPGAANAAT